MAPGSEDPPATRKRSAKTPARYEASGAKRRSWVWAATLARSSSSRATGWSRVGGATEGPRRPPPAVKRAPRSSRKGFTVTKLCDHRPMSGARWTPPAAGPEAVGPEGNERVTILALKGRKPAAPVVALEER